MPVVTITKTEYTEAVSNTSDTFSAQSRASHGVEYLFAEAPPTGSGILVPGAPGNVITRALGDGKLYLRVPGNAPYETDSVVVTP